MRDGTEGDYNRRGGKSLHAPCRECMQKNKMLLHPLLAGGFDLNMPRPGILLAALVSQREDKKPWQLKTSSKKV
jgi:hypothetical protein